MKIHSIYIDGYKNLKNMEIFMPEDSSVAAVIGNNGSGKSNILEALTQVFTAVYNEKPVDFRYKICYSIYDDNFEISNLDGVQFLKNGKKVKKQDKRGSLPRGIFLYYCGETDRLRKLALDCVDKAFENALKNDGDVTTKYISCVGLREFTAAVLSNAKYENETFRKVCELIGIQEIGGPVEFHLSRPVWSKKAPLTEDSFWNAQGSVAMLLHMLKDSGELIKLDKDNALIRVNRISDISLDSENPFDLFVRFELLIQAGILSDITFTIIKDGEALSPDMLSEGEKQLAQFLCLLEATKEYRALFLLDEFDSFLHPNWQRRFAEIISEIHITGQVLFTTHSPLTLGKMQKESIRILKDGVVYEPAADTFNRDITEVLEEIMEVGKRPIEVEDAMQRFRNAAMHREKEAAQKAIDELTTLLSKDDPFWVTVSHMMARLER